MKTSLRRIIPLASIIVASELLRTQTIAAPELFASVGTRLVGKVYANGISIAYESFGPTNRETVLLIMGTGGQLTQWPPELLAKLVERGYRVVCYDNRDVGLSTHLDAAGLPDWMAIGAALKAGKRAPLTYTLDDMAKDAVGLLDALGINQAHLVGASMGGMIAQIVATKFPERTRSLTSIMAGSGNPALPIPAKPDVIAKMPPPILNGSTDAIIAREIKVWQVIGSPGYPTDEELLRTRVTEAVKRSYYPAGIERQGAAAAFAGDRRPSLKSIKAPTSVVHGSEDPIVPLEGGREVAASIPGAELRVIPGMGHDIPDALVPVVLEAITSTASRAAGREAR